MGNVGYLLSYFTKNEAPQQRAVEPKHYPPMKDLTQIQLDLDAVTRELNMLRVLQKEYTLDLIDFAKWQEMI